jgi:hypothetical protein
MQNETVVAYYEILSWSLAGRAKVEKSQRHSRPSGRKLDPGLPNTNECYPLDLDTRQERLEPGTSVIQSRSVSHLTAMFGDLLPR